MTLKVGEAYRGVWCDGVSWLVITAIEVLQNGNTMIRFQVTGSVNPKRVPRFLHYFLGASSENTAAGFVGRLDEGKRLDAEAERKAHQTSVAKRLQEVEVRYR